MRNIYGKTYISTWVILRSSLEKAIYNNLEIEIRLKIASIVNEQNRINEIICKRL